MLIVMGPSGTANAKGLEEQLALEESDNVTICHKIGTQAEKTLAIPTEDLAGHFGHGDGMGACIAGGAVAHRWPRSASLPLRVTSCKCSTGRE